MSTEIFRKEALQKMQSPDDLNQLLVVVTPRSWLLIMTIAGLCAVVLAWSIFGKIPISVDGFGVLISPGNVKGLQSDTSGQITQLHVSVGQQIKAGDVIAEVNQPDLVQQLEQSREKLPELERFHEVTEENDRSRLDLEARAVEEQTKFISDEIERAGKLAEKTSLAAVTYADKQRENLNRSRQMLSDLNTSLKSRVKTISDLRREGLTSDDTVLSIRSSAMESELKVANIEVQAQELEMQDVRRQETELQTQNRLSDLRLQLLQMGVKKKQLEQQIIVARRTRELEISELRDRIKTLEFRLAQQTKIKSSYTGRILELSVSSGQLVAQGMRLATIDVDSSGSPLKNLAYFKIKDGKRIQAGDRILVTPANVERERFGSIVGKVNEVAPFPITRQGAVNEIGSEEIVESLMSSGGAIEIVASLESDPSSISGFKWTSKGPDMKFSAGTTTTVRVIVEQRRPITYVIPMLRTWLFAEKDDRVPAF